MSVAGKGGAGLPRGGQGLGEQPRRSAQILVDRGVASCTKVISRVGT